MGLEARHRGVRLALMESPRIPAFANSNAGGAAPAIEALREDRRFDLRTTAPNELQEALENALGDEPSTIVVAGGDGTVSTAASAVVGTPTALCILRSGTLNHFARRLGIPADPRKALEVAFTGETTRVDVGWVNDHLFLNTCVAGLYVAFVSRRDRLSPRIGYVASSLVAGVRTFSDFRSSNLDLEIEGRQRTYASALLFVGVGERDFRLPLAGEPIDAGKRGLHVIVANSLSRARLAMMIVRAPVRGIRPWPSGEPVDSFIVDSFHAALHRAVEQITVDGEILEISGELAFQREASALAVRVPAT